MIMTGSQPSCIKTWKLSDLILSVTGDSSSLCLIFLSLNPSQQQDGLLSHTLRALKSLSLAGELYFSQPAPSAPWATQSGILRMNFPLEMPGSGAVSLTPGSI